MPFAKFSLFSKSSRVLLWSACLIALSAATALLVAFFLAALDVMTHLRWAHPWLLWLLPVAGIPIALLYHHLGRDSHRGNKLIIEEIHQPGGGIPRRMAPLVLLTSLVTHLFGGSAGREGTAVQVGGAIAQAFVKPFRFSADGARVLLLCGMAAGFGAVFGTPITGALFALEVTGFARVRGHWLLATLIASYLADFLCIGVGIHHTVYTVASTAPGLAVLPALLILALSCALAAGTFVHLGHALQKLISAAIPIHWLRPVVGGLAVVALTYALQTRDYLGIGVVTQSGHGTSIVNAFRAGGVNELGWLWKLVFTAITLSAGFKGGEVTPLFFIGATLGNFLAGFLGLPTDLCAALCFVTVFAAATRTPFACIIMGMELFGARYAPLFAVTCLIACAMPTEEK